MSTLASLSDVEAYYKRGHQRLQTFPSETSFARALLTGLTAKTVLNIGCGPRLYDHLRLHRCPPKLCVGFDINKNVIDFLSQSFDPALSMAREACIANGTDVKLICGDALDPHALPADHPFDCVVGLGFFGMFGAQPLTTIMTNVRKVIEPGATLITVTWHCPFETAEQKDQRYEKGCDYLGDLSPDELTQTIQNLGFDCISDQRRPCGQAYGWDMIQACAFKAR